MPPLYESNTGKKVFSNIEKANIISNAFADAHRTTYDWRQTQVGSTIQQSIHQIFEDQQNTTIPHTNLRDVKRIINRTKNLKNRLVSTTFKMWS